MVKKCDKESLGKANVECRITNVLRFKENLKKNRIWTKTSVGV